MFNVRDFPTFQAAHDALPASGGTIFVPAGTYTSATTTAFTGLVVTKPLALIGEPNGPAAALSIIIHDMANAQNIDAISLNVAAQGVLRNLFIQGNNIVGSGRGVRWYKAGATAQMRGLTIDNVTVWRSPNLSFECVCDGGSNIYVSKLEMIQCNAFEAKSGGSLLIGGAGTNNNSFERCEFNGPGFGGFHNVASCTLTSGIANVSAPDLTTVQVGDEVSGIGVVVGTTVVSVNTAGSPDTMVLSKVAIESLTTVLTFYRASGPGAGQLPRGHVHLMRTSISRFQHCSFQGPGTSPAISTDLVSNDLELRDCYREKSTAGSEVHSFILNNMSNFLIDGLYHQFHTANSMLLKTGPGGLFMGRITNAQLVCGQNPLASTNVVELGLGTDELIIDNSMEQSSITGMRRDLVVSGAGAVLPTIASAAAIALPNGSDEYFLVSGTTPITSMVARRPKRRVTLIFTGTAQMTDGGNLRLNGNFTGGANRTITLLCDGTNWLELARSIN
jgi:hypothetical protein